MNFILVQYDPFVMESRCFVVKDKKIQQSLVASNLNSLAQELVTNAYLFDVYHIKLAAPTNIFNAVNEEIATIEASNYGENKITMENG